MSLWLQSTMQALHDGHYERVRRDLLPLAPIPIPECLIREAEFGERRCRDTSRDRLFPIRFLWLLEGNEQRLWSYPPLGRSRYHPEMLLDLWERSTADSEYRLTREAEGFRFDETEKAVDLTAGWIYIGERFIQDLFEVEAAIGVELQFPGGPSGERRPAFPAHRRPPSSGGGRS
jgi:hypothetical protein